MKQDINAILQEATSLLQAMQAPGFLTQLDALGTLLHTAAKARQTIFIAGNGGSWADADHFAGELRAQFEIPGRVAVPALAVPVSLSTLTAWGNDYTDGFEGAMRRDLEALSRPGDVLIVISTSGKAKNIRSAMAWAKEHGLTIIAISGNGPQSPAFGALAHHHLAIPHTQTARIQEAYQVVIHILCSYIDQL